MMKKIIFLTLVAAAFTEINAQGVTGKLKFEQGQALGIKLDVKTTIAQQAMGQAIDFNVDAVAEHNYKVTNATEDNTTLHHQVKKIAFNFDGMGQKMKFDSDKEKDMNGAFGKSIKDLLEKKYDIIIDSGGLVLMSMPESVKLEEKDSRMAIIMSMLKDVMDLVQPPKKNTPSFFKILPDKETNKGDSWSTASNINGVKKQTTYKLTDITDSTLVVDFTENSTSVTKANMMGAETTTTLNNKSTGKIILDRLTGITKEQTTTIESNGNAVGVFGTVPVTSKTTTKITIEPDSK